MSSIPNSECQIASSQHHFIDCAECPDCVSAGYCVYWSILLLRGACKLYSRPIRIKLLDDCIRTKSGECAPSSKGINVEKFCLLIVVLNDVLTASTAHFSYCADCVYCAACVDDGAVGSADCVDWGRHCS